MANLKVGNTNVGRISVIEPYDDSTPLDNDGFEPWVRPSHWLDMPVMNSGDEKISILLAIPSGIQTPYRVVLYGTEVNASISHTYSTIDWGDGTSDLLTGYYNNDTYIDHTYSFEDLDQSTEYIQDGILSRQALLNIDNSASGCRYFQTLFLGPNNVSEGNNLLQSKGNTTSILELNIASDMLEILTTWSSQYPRNSIMQRFKLIGNCKLTSATSLFYQCKNLQSVELPSGFLSNATTASSMFVSCYKLKAAPWFDTSNLTNMGAMFNSCMSLRSVPQYDTSNNTSFYYFFNDCRALKEIPYLDHSSSTSSQGEFRNCYSLEKIHSGIDYSNTTITQDMFTTCLSLKSIPSDFFSTMTNVSLARSMFATCVSLESVPAVDLPSATEVNSLFSSCTNLREVEIENVSNVTTATYGMGSIFTECRNLEKVTFNNPEEINASRIESMFRECRKLKVAPYFNTSSGTNLSSMFLNCYDLTDVPVYDLTSATNTNSMFNACISARKFNGFNTKNSNLAYMPNMFYNCQNLEEYPSGIFDGSVPVYRMDQLFYNTHKAGRVFDEDIVASGYYAFRRYYDLETVNNFTPSGNCQDMFRDCSYLRSLGDLDFTHVTDLTNWLYAAWSRFEWSDIKNVNVDHSYANCFLSSGAISHIINNLPTVSSTTSISFTNCWGAQNLHPDTISIATSKGWTVTT